MWTYGENESQNYYELRLGKDYLCVFANKSRPDIWLGFYTKNGKDVTVMDKTFNDEQRKKDERNSIGTIFGYPFSTTIMLLSSPDAELMKRKVLWAYEHGVTEVSLED